MVARLRIKSVLSLPVMKLSTVPRYFVGVSLFFLAAAHGFAGFTLGNDAVDRAFADGWSDFAVVLLDEEFAFDAVVTEWEVFANMSRTNEAEGDLGLLLLRPDALDDDLYSVVGSDIRTVDATGKYEFDFAAYSGSASVLAGDKIGIYIGTARIDYDRVGDQDLVEWSPSSGTISSLSQLTVGSTLELSGNGANDDRVYSINVTAVPEPSALLGLLTVTVLGSLFVRRRR